MSTLANSSGEANDQAARAKHRRTIRYVAGALCAVTAVIYFLIGFHVVSVLD
ncbi:MAG: hypothetical protein IH587_12575, partial [Anaerolineae bacterium]|nr:hypothetical protein [Anaerolineae bacterium]